MTTVAVLLLFLAAAIMGWQRRAAACPAHDRRVGAVAWGLCALCGLAGTVLLLLSAAAPN